MPSRINCGQIATLIPKKFSLEEYWVNNINIITLLWFAGLESHIASCAEISRSAANPCPDDVECTSKAKHHYTQFREEDRKKIINAYFTCSGSGLFCFGILDPLILWKKTTIFFLSNFYLEWKISLIKRDGFSGPLDPGPWIKKGLAYPNRK